MTISREKKSAYFIKLEALLEQYSKLFIVSADHVGSHQMQQIRQSLRGSGEVLFGKNTMMRKVINQFVKKNNGHPIEKVLPAIYGNIGFVFTNADLAAVRTKILDNKVPAPARVGTIAPVDVFVKAGPTGCEPGMTSFFQALSIATKIAKGQIEIISEIHLIKKGDKVEPGQSVLLGKLNILPFSYGLKIEQVYDNGAIFSPEVLDLKDEDIEKKLVASLATVAAFSLGAGYPTALSVPYSVAGAFSKLVSIALATEYSFPAAQTFKDFLADPSKFVVAAAAPAASAAAPAAAAAPVKEESEEEEDVGAGGLFDF